MKVPLRRYWDLLVGYLRPQWRRALLLALLLGSSIAGLAGGFYAHFLTFIMSSNFGFGQSIFILCMVVFGGIGTRWGPVVGAVILGLLPEIFRPIMEYRTFIYGILLLAMMRFQPGGLLGQSSFLARGFKRLAGLRKEGAHAPP